MLTNKLCKLIWAQMVGAFFAASGAYAQDITIAAIDLPGLYTPAADGIYDAAYAAASARANISIPMQVLPPARAIDQFLKQQVDCLAPMDAEFIGTDFPTVQTRPFFIARIFIFTAEGQAPLNSLAQLKGKKVGIRKGMIYGSEFDAAGLSVSVADSIESNIKKVQKGRLDAFIAYTPDAFDAFDPVSYTHLTLPTIYSV